MVAKVPMDSGWNRWTVRPPYLQAMFRGSTGLLVVVLRLTCQAQNWCTPGATWVYEYDLVLGGYYGVQRVEYVGDTLLGGYAAQRLKQTDVVAPVGTTDFVVYPSTFYIHTRYDNEVVYTWDNVNAYDTLFWFGAAPGDRWNAPGWPDDGNIALTVLDTATVLADGLPLRRLIVEPIPGWPIDTVYERIGGLRFHLNGGIWFVTDAPYDGLLCYSDQEIEYTAPGVSDCGFTLSVTGFVHAKDNAPVPNPGTDQFTLTLSPGPHTIALFDATGREVLRESVPGDRATIDCSALASGLFVYRLLDGAGLLMGIGIWIKE